MEERKRKNKREMERRRKKTGLTRKKIKETDKI